MSSSSPSLYLTCNADFCVIKFPGIRARLCQERASYMEWVLWAQASIVMNYFPLKTCRVAGKQFRNKAVHKLMLLVYVGLTVDELPRDHQWSNFPPSLQQCRCIMMLKTCRNDAAVHAPVLRSRGLNCRFVFCQKFLQQHQFLERLMEHSRGHWATLQHPCSFFAKCAMAMPMPFAARRSDQDGFIIITNSMKTQ